MAATLTTIIDNVDVGVTASRASNITKLTLAAATIKFAIQALFTPVAQEPSTLVVYFAQSIDDLTANLATVDRLRAVAKALSFPQMAVSNQPLQLTSDQEAVRGAYVYVWVQEGNLSGTAKLSVKSIELP